MFSLFKYDDKQMYDYFSGSMWLTRNLSSFMALVIQYNAWKGQPFPVKFKYQWKWHNPDLSDALMLTVEQWYSLLKHKNQKLKLYFINKNTNYYIISKWFSFMFIIYGLQNFWWAWSDENQEISAACSLWCWWCVKKIGKRRPLLLHCLELPDSSGQTMARWIRLLHWQQYLGWLYLSLLSWIIIILFNRLGLRNTFKR